MTTPAPFGLKAEADRGTVRARLHRATAAAAAAGLAVFGGKATR